MLFARTEGLVEQTSLFSAGCFKLLERHCTKYLPGNLRNLSFISLLPPRFAFSGPLNFPFSRVLAC